MYLAGLYNINGSKPLSFPSSRVCEDREATIATAISMASTIASKSPVAIQGSKFNLIYSRDHSVPDSLEYAVSSVGISNVIGQI